VVKVGVGWFPEIPTRNFGGARRRWQKLRTQTFSTEKVTRLSRRNFANRIALPFDVHTRTHNVPTTAKMRPLTEPETKVLFEKLATYCGKGISNLIADPSGGTDRNVFRVQVIHHSHLTPKQPSNRKCRAQESTMSAPPSPTSPPPSRAKTSSP
jgi:hypothetical protein